MGDWEAGYDNTWRGSALWNQSEAPDDNIATNDWTTQGYIVNENGLNRTQSLSTPLEKNSTVIKNQTSEPITIYDNQSWQEAKDVFLFAKLKATDVLHSVKILTDGKFGSWNFPFVNIYVADRVTQKPILWDEKTVTTSTLSWVDDTSVGDNHKTVFTFNSSNLVHVKDWYANGANAGMKLTVAGSSALSAGDYWMGNFSRPSASTVSFTLSTNISDVAGTYVDLGTSASNQTETFSFVRNLGVRSIFDGDQNSQIADLTPDYDNVGELMNWENRGKTLHSLAKREVHRKSLIDSGHTAYANHTWVARSYARPMTKDDICYLGCSFLRPINLDDGKTYVKLGFTVDYGVQQ